MRKSTFSMSRKAAIASLITEKTTEQKVEELVPTGEEEGVPAPPMVEEEKESEESEESEEPEMTIKTVYMMEHSTNYEFLDPNTEKRERYYYLDSQQLPQLFDFVKENNAVSESTENLSIADPHLSYQIHLGLFRVNHNGMPFPYLTFLLQLEEEELHFPHFEYTPTIPNMVNGISSSPEEDESSESPLQTEFMNQCISKISDLYPDSVEKRPQYLGFVSSKAADTTHLYVFFDMGPLFLEESTEDQEEGDEPDQEEKGDGDEPGKDGESNPLKWACLEEIILYKSLNGTPVKEHLATLFTSHPELYTIRNKYGNPVPTPHRLFLCETSTIGEIANVLFDKENPEVGEKSSLRPISTKREHPIFGPIYQFTHKPVAGYTPELMRYIGFVEDAVYLFKEVSSTEPISTPLEDAPCIYFKEGEHIFWAFRSSASFTLLP